MKGIRRIDLSESKLTYNRYIGFGNNKSKAQKFAKDLRKEIKESEISSVAVRVEKRKEGWVVNEFDL